jgi:transcriptional regulator with XRE-family HTH domain
MIFYRYGRLCGNRRRYSGSERRTKPYAGRPMIAMVAVIAGRGAAPRRADCHAWNMRMPRHPDSADKEIGLRLKVRRQELNITQEQLGEALQITFQQIQKYEKGTNRIASGRLKEISRILKVPPSYFFDDLPDESSRELLTLLNAGRSLRLVKAFTRIQSIAVQDAVIQLVQQLADAPASPGQPKVPR